jgi:hypothetical protein
VSRLPKALLGALLCVALCASVALAAGAAPLVIRSGDLVITAEGGFTPTTLPRHENAPITIYGGGKLETASGELPPILKTLDIDFDRHGAVDTAGLPVCPESRLEATTTAQARKACPGAIVGEGTGSAVIAFPEQKPITLTSPITLFNGPSKHGDPTVIAHAHLGSPVSTTYLIPVVIETIHKGAYGYQTVATIPKLAGGYGVPVSGSLKIGKKWTYKGRQHSYVSARCETGKLQAQANFTFADGTRLAGTFLRTCKVSG